MAKRNQSGAVPQQQAIKLVLGGTAFLFLLLLLHKLYRRRKEQAYIDACEATYGTLSEEQKSNIRLIAQVFDKEGDGDQNKLIYILATAWHESKFIPKPERRAGSSQPALKATQDRYWGSGYYGRGLVQITWESNYKEMSDTIGVDLVNNPELALVPIHAARLLVLGMLEGNYGPPLSKYINESKIDFYNARRSVNGTDKAQKIAEEAEKIHKYLQQWTINMKHNHTKKQE